MQKSVLKNWTLQTRTKYNKQKNILVGLAKKLSEIIMKILI